MSNSKFRYTGRDKDFGRRFEDGGAAGSPFEVKPTTPGMWSDEDEGRLQATNATIQDNIMSRGLHQMDQNIANAIKKGKS